MIAATCYYNQRLTGTDRQGSNAAGIVRAIVNIGSSDAGIPVGIQLDGQVLTERRWIRVVFDCDIGSTSTLVSVVIRDSQGHRIGAHIIAVEGIRCKRQAGNAAGIVRTPLSTSLAATCQVAIGIQT